MIGIGIGILIGTFVMLGVKINYQLSNYQIENKARSMGMIYPEDAKVISKDKGVGK